MVDRLTDNPPGDSSSKDSSHNYFYLVCCRSGSNSVNVTVVLALRLAYWVRVIGSQTTVPVAPLITVVDVT
jgi:hypothetical protein